MLIQKGVSRRLRAPGCGRGRLKLVVTNVKALQLAYIDDWETKAELIDANMASAHIPFFLDWRPFATYRFANIPLHCLL